MSVTSATLLNENFFKTYDQKPVDGDIVDDGHGNVFIHASTGWQPLCAMNQEDAENAFLYGLSPAVTISADVYNLVSVLRTVSNHDPRVTGEDFVQAVFNVIQAAGWEMPASEDDDSTGDVMLASADSTECVDVLNAKGVCEQMRDGKKFIELKLEGNKVEFRNTDDLSYVAVELD